MSRTHRLALLAPLVLALAPLARAGGLTGTLDPPVTSRARGVLTLAVSGRVTGAPATPLVARLRRDDHGTPLAIDAPALETPLVPGADGAFAVALETPALLLEGEYVVEVAAAGDRARSSLSRPFRLGTPAQAAAAEARLVAWYRGAYGTVRDLCLALERRGRFHAALLRRARTAEKAKEQRGHFQVQFLDAGWRSSLITARMDVAVWQRRLVLPAHAEVGRDLLAVLAALEARAREWEKVLANASLPDPADAALAPPIAGLCASVASLGSGADAPTPAVLLADWPSASVVDPLAVPPAGDGSLVLDDLAWDASGHGLLRDVALGFQLEVPRGAKALATDRAPNERLILSVPDAAAVGSDFKVVVQVQSLPDARTPEALDAQVELGAWEGYLSYERLRSEPILEGGALRGRRLELTADVVIERDDGSRAEVQKVVAVRRSVWPAGGRRLVTLIVARPPGTPWSPAMARLEASLVLLDGPRPGGP